MRPAWADCPGFDDPIATDRPSVANSSAVVPVGSLQMENGAAVSRGQGVTTYDLPETRLRLGLIACTEILMDLPDYTHASMGAGMVGATNIAPAIKHQFLDVPDGVTLSGAIGTQINSGDKTLAGRGPAPFVQLPWSYDLGQGWSANGMYGLTVHPRDTGRNPSNQTDVFVDKALTQSADVFVEYTNDYLAGAAVLNRVSLGGSYRYDPTHQIDVKVGAGLNSASPDWYLLVGYSLRLDRVFFR